MKSLEIKSEPYLDMPMSSHFPAFHVCDEQMEEISEWEADGEYTIKVKVKVKSKTQSATIDGIDTDAQLEVLAYETEK